MNKRAIPSILLSTLLLSGTATAQTCTNTNMAQATPTSRYTFGAGGVVTDNTTGLMWKRCLQGQTFSDNGTPGNYLDDHCTGAAVEMTWQAALNQAQTANGLNDSGYNGWQLPNLKELQSTVEYCRKNPAINTEVFPGWSSLWLWSSTPLTNPEYVSFTWTSGFGSGGVNSVDRLRSEYVRLVRSTQ